MPFHGRFPFPPYAAGPLRRHRRANLVWLAVVASMGLALSIAHSASLLGAPLRLAAGQPVTTIQAGAQAQPYRVLVTGISRASGETCFVRARAWTGGTPGTDAVRAQVELVVPLALTGGGHRAQFLPGSVFECRARPYLPEPALNPYEYDPRAALARDGIAVRLRVEALTGPGPSPGRAGEAQAGAALPALGQVRTAWYRLRYAPVRLSAACRWRLEDLFELHLSPAGSALARALMLGDRGWLEEHQTLGFERSGSLHLMAVSGLHVGFLAGVIGFVCSACRVDGKARNAAVTAGTGLFALITGAGPAVLRAAVMLNAGLWHPAGRRSSPLNSLGLAALVILASNPLQIADAGFQLSFAATLGIIAWSGRAGTSAAARLRGALLSSYGAQVTGLPVLLHHFYRFAPWAPLNNLLLLPLGGLVISALFAVSCAGLVLPVIFAVLAWPVDALLRLLAAVAETLSRLPWSMVVTGRPSPAATLAALVFVAHVGLLRSKTGGGGEVASAGSRSGPATTRRRPVLQWPDWPSRRVILTAGALVLLYLQAVWLHRPGPGLTASFFAVGQGDAALVRCGRQAVLVDFGPPAPPGGTGASRFARCVLPYLQATRAFPSLGILSHPHADHVGGLGDAMRQFPGMRVLTRDCFEEAARAWLDPDKPWLTARLVPVDREGVLTLPADARAGSSLVLELFWAPGLGPGAHVNELSCAVRVRCAATPDAPTRVDGAGGGWGDGAGAFLFAGDLGL
ncbi:MAG: ComEC/Rec2 family competence protein, partial [Bacillota bacterium]|nr:ComEC/Rec2 family competence protein [Bacillota bacterium]